MNRFHAVDYILFTVMLLISLGIGVYSAFTGGSQKTTSEYLMGNRQLKLGPVALSICVSMISANTLVGVPAETYGFGISYGMIGIFYTFVWCYISIHPGTSYLSLECHQHSPVSGDEIWFTNLEVVWSCHTDYSPDSLCRNCAVWTSYIFGGIDRNSHMGITYCGVCHRNLLHINRWYESSCMDRYVSMHHDDSR